MNSVMKSMKKTSPKVGNLAVFFKGGICGSSFTHSFFDKMKILSGFLAVRH